MNRGVVIAIVISAIVAVILAIIIPVSLMSSDDDKKDDGKKDDVKTDDVKTDDVKTDDVKTDDGSVGDDKTTVLPVGVSVKIDYTWNNGFNATDEEDKKMTVDDVWNFFDHTGKFVFKWGQKATVNSVPTNVKDAEGNTCTLQLGQAKYVIISKVPKGDDMIILGDRLDKIKFVYLDPDANPTYLIGYESCSGSGAVVSYTKNKF